MTRRMPLTACVLAALALHAAVLVRLAPGRSAVLRAGPVAVTRMVLQPLTLPLPQPQPQPQSLAIAEATPLAEALPAEEPPSTPSQAPRPSQAAPAPAPGDTAADEPAPTAPAHADASTTESSPLLPAATEPAAERDLETYFTADRLAKLPQPLAKPTLDSATARMALAAAPARVELLIDDLGRVVRVRRLQGLSGGDAWRAVQEALLRTAFAPGRRHGGAVKSALEIELAVEGEELQWPLAAAPALDPPAL